MTKRPGAHAVISVNEQFASWRRGPLFVPGPSQAFGDDETRWRISTAVTCPPVDRREDRRRVGGVGTLPGRVSEQRERPGEDHESCATCGAAALFLTSEENSAS